MRPFFSYFGGKWRIAPRYPAPANDTIIEPFAGAAGYSVRYPERRVILTDLDERVVGTWQYLIRTSAEEIMRLPLIDGSWETTDDLAISQEARWLIGWWLNKGAGGKRPSAWARSETNPNAANYWGAGARLRIASQVDQIRHWTAALCSYEDIADQPATWYVDPPYEVAGIGYKHSRVDYTALGQWCQSRTGQVIVCENVGATWLPFRPFVSAKATAGARRAGVSHEAIWLNTDDVL